MPHPWGAELDTVGTSIAAANEAIVQSIVSKPSSALRSGLSTLEKVTEERDPTGPPTDEFWEDAGSFD